MLHSTELKIFLFYASYAVFPFILWQVWWLYRWRWQRKLLPIAALLLSGLFIWMRFIEPQTLHIRQTTIAHTGIDARIALISDLHIGLYKDPVFLQRVVERINQMDVDIVLLAGDLTYYPTEPLQEIFSSLKNLRFPTYAVLGNHDQLRPGPDIDVELRAALAELNVQIIEGQIVDMGKFMLAGLGDHWAKKDQPDFINQGKFSKPLMVLMHNPDSAMALDARKVSMAFAGHTHCGQVRLPTQPYYFSSSVYELYCGLNIAHTPQGALRVFTTGGVGESGVPLRFLSPPTIDYIQLTR